MEWISDKRFLGKEYSIGVFYPYLEKKHEWDLPAMEELDDIRPSIYKVNLSLERYVKKMNSSFLYWSSSTCIEERMEAHFAWCLCLADGNIGEIHKQSISYSRTYALMCSALHNGILNVIIKNK
jgi:hypothetical protein